MADRNPKYSYGLLGTPDSSDLSNFDTTGLTTPGGKESIRNQPGSGTSGASLKSGILGGGETSAGNDSPAVFQIPGDPAPRKTPASRRTPLTYVGPKLLGVRNTPGSSSLSQSARGTPRTKGTPRNPAHETPTTRSAESSVIVTVVEGRGLARGEMGLASIDLKHPVLTLSQFSDSQTYVNTLTKLKILKPVEVVFPSTMCDNGTMAKVFKVVNENFQDCNISTVQRHYFNERNGLEFVKKLVIKENNSVVMDVKSKYYCLAASAALIKYVEFIQNTVYAAASLRVVFRGSEETTLIDANTASALELTVNLNNPKSNQSLFGVLNRAKTLGGARLLRSSILQPPTDLDTIQARLECVAELTESSELFYGLRSTLSRFEIDIDHLISSLVQIAKQDSNKARENRINTCILLKHVTEIVPALREALEDAKCDLFQAYCASLQDARFCAITSLLQQSIHEDARYQKGSLNMRTQRCFAVKPNKSGVLDMFRQTYTEQIDDFNEMVRQLSTQHNLTLKTSHNATRGFHVQVPTKEATNLPEDFIKVTKTKKYVSFTTEDLMKLNTTIERSMIDINLIADGLVSDLLAQVRGSIGCLYNLSEIVSTLDMLLCFAQYRTTTECVRPEFTDTLAIKGGRHPVLDRTCTSYIPNNVYASDGANFNVVTGPNMSGKTTYLKMLAQLQVMAQMGCYVPADFASFRVTSQIFSRVGSDDDLETNSSTFMLEMKEVNYIIQNVTGNSLVIVDELGRGTSSEEGVGLCWAICELLLSEKAFTFFATHFLEICRLETIYPNVENYHFQIKHVMCNKGSFRKVLFTYVMSRGFTKETHYGLKLAELFDFPDQVMEQAREIAAKIDKKSEAADAKTSHQQRKDNAAYKFATKLLQVSRSSRLDDQALKNYVNSLRAAYLEELEQSATPGVQQDNLIDPERSVVSEGSKVNDPVSPHSSTRDCDVTIADVTSASVKSTVI